MNPAALIAKSNNKKNILNYIINYEDVTRIKLAAALELSAGTITNLVTELLSQNILLEGREAYYKHGRKTKFLKFNGDYAYVVCIDMVDQDMISINICNLMGESILSDYFYIDLMVSDTNPIRAIIQALTAQIAGFLETLHEPVRQKLCALAVSISGMVDMKNLINIPIYNWQSVNLTTPLEAAFHLPVYIDNVTRIKSVYETRRRNEIKNIVYLNLSPGIGMAHYFDGKLIGGLNGISGEAGHMSINMHGEKCYCGNYGCFEMYCGHKDLLKRAKNALPAINEQDALYQLVYGQNLPLTLDTLSLAMKQGSVFTYDFLMETGKYLGQGIANLLNIFDPDVFITSGYGMDFDPFILDIAQAEARSRIVNTFHREVHFEYSQLKKEESYKAITAYVLKDKLNELASQ